MSGAKVAEFLGSPVLTNILLVIVVLLLFLRAGALDCNVL